MRFLRLWLCALTLLLSVGAFAQDNMTISVSYSARGMLLEKDKTGKVIASKLPKGQPVTMTITVKGGTPPYQVWVDVPQAGATAILSGKGPFSQSVNLYHDSGESVTTTVHAEDSVGRPATAGIKFDIKDPLSPLRSPRPIRTTPKPPTPKPTVVPGTPYTPIGNVAISGPSRVKAGASETWAGSFTGGVPPYHYRWRGEGPKDKIVVDDKKGVRGKLRRGPVTLTFLVWDDHSPLRKMATMTVQVDEDTKPTPPPAADSDSIGGWWLWNRGASDKVPIFLEPQSNGDFNGPYWPQISMGHLAKAQGNTTSRLGFRRLSGGAFRYIYSYPNGTRGKGTMTFQAASASGDWKDDPPGKNAGNWTWSRPSAAQLKKLEDFFKRKDKR